MEATEVPWANSVLLIHRVALPVGAIVGYLTNWIALKLIFEPVEPTRIGPFLLHGMFLQRQQVRFLASNL